MIDLKEKWNDVMGLWAKIEAMYNNKAFVKKLSIAFLFMGFTLLGISIVASTVPFLSVLLKGIAYGFIGLFMVGYLIMYFVHKEDLLEAIFKMFDKKDKKKKKEMEKKDTVQVHRWCSRCHRDKLAPYKDWTYDDGDICPECQLKEGA